MSRLRNLSADYLVLSAIVVATLVLSLFLNQFLLSLIILIFYWAYLGNAWNIMAGYAGQFSFGHAMFYGIGAYTSTVLLVDYAISPWVGMLVGAVLGALFGVVVGASLRRS